MNPGPRRVAVPVLVKDGKPTAVGVAVSSSCSANNVSNCGLIQTSSSPSSHSTISTTYSPPNYHGVGVAGIYSTGSSNYIQQLSNNMSNLNNNPSPAANSGSNGKMSYGESENQPQLAGLASQTW
jgi:hypothetical protein